MVLLLSGLRIFRKAPPRLADEVLQNIVLATAQTILARSLFNDSLQTPHAIHHALMTLFVATIGQDYLTPKDLCRASDIFWQWVPKILHGRMI